MRTTIATISVNDLKSLVSRRISFINKLNTAQEKEDNKMDELVNADGKWYALPGKDYQGLRCYMLLTCFDLLGRLPKTESLADDHYDGHCLDLAVRNNFYCFINEVISPLRKRQLLDSINLVKKNQLTGSILFSKANDDEKLRFLFALRCSYMRKEITTEEVGGRYAATDNRESSAACNDYYIHMQSQPAIIIAILEEVLNREE